MGLRAELNLSDANLYSVKVSYKIFILDWQMHSCKYYMCSDLSTQLLKLTSKSVKDLRIEVHPCTR